MTASEAARKLVERVVQREMPGGAEPRDHNTLLNIAQTFALVAIAEALEARNADSD